MKYCKRCVYPENHPVGIVFDDEGKHARAAVSCNSLPLGAAVEIDAIFEV